MAQFGLALSMNPLMASRAYTKAPSRTVFDRIRAMLLLRRRKEHCSPFFSGRTPFYHLFQHSEFFSLFPLPSIKSDSLALCLPCSNLSRILSIRLFLFNKSKNDFARFSFYPSNSLSSPFLAGPGQDHRDSSPLDVLPFLDNDLRIYLPWLFIPFDSSFVYSVFR